MLKNILKFRHDGSYLVIISKSLFTFCNLLIYVVELLNTIVHYKRMRAILDNFRAFDENVSCKMVGLANG
jgi:hypothetical protein